MGWIPTADLAKGDPYLHTIKVELIMQRAPGANKKTGAPGSKHTEFLQVRATEEGSTDLCHHPLYTKWP